MIVQRDWIIFSFFFLFFLPTINYAYLPVCVIRSELEALHCRASDALPNITLYKKLTNAIRNYAKQITRKSSREITRDDIFIIGYISIVCYTYKKIHVCLSYAVAECMCHVFAGFPANISVAQIECGLSLSTTDIINI